MEQPSTPVGTTLDCTAQAAETEVHYVRAYDAGGNVRVPTPCRIGDTVHWKRDGSRGAWRCRVLRFGTTSSGAVRMRVRLLSHDGVPCQPALRWITDRGVLRAIATEPAPRGVLDLTETEVHIP